MDSAGIFSRQLSETVQQLKTRLEFEEYFSEDYLPGAKSLVAAQELLAATVEINPKPEVSIAEDSKKMLANPLYQKVQTCVLCDLHKTRTNVVFGEGSLDAELVFIGEAPGRDEDLQAKPFVGLAGGLLTKIINAMKMNRADVFITNVLRCRPPHNRNPLPEEVIYCKPYLIELLNIIKPKVICTLGKFATHALLDETSPISQLRGKLYDFNGMKVIPTYHPAYLLRNPEDKKLVWDDMKKILNVLKADEARELY
ncbi:MAG: uracil-DNA glycosylase [Candidatus Omnitrophota bacterium]